MKRKNLLYAIWGFNAIVFAAIVFMLAACTPAKETPVAADSTVVVAVDTVEAKTDTTVVVDSLQSN